jgi:thymidylate kinase
LKATKLILVDGVPGSGKSTMAQRLGRSLARAGVPHRWWYEGERGHPAYSFHDSAALAETLGHVFSGDAERVQRVIEASLAQWRALAQTQTQSNEVLIFDGILYGHLMWTMMPADVPHEVTAAYVAETEAIIAPLRPSVVYLRPVDVGAAMARITARRGSDWTKRFIQRHDGFPYCRRRGWQGFEGLVAFWSDYREFADELFARSALDKVQVDVDGADWSSGLREVSAFLALDVAALQTMRDPVRASVREPMQALGQAPDQMEVEWGRYVGTYGYVHRGKRGRCEITCEERSLLVTGVPHIWPQTRLIPDEATASARPGDRAEFVAESLPFRFSFIVDGAGVVHTMEVSGPAFVWDAVPKTYRRVGSRKAALASTP